jgi:hypothetical protein
MTTRSNSAAEARFRHPMQVRTGRGVEDTCPRCAASDTVDDPTAIE